jgi:hypothetical protein
MLAGSPSINGLLIGCLANCQRIFLGGDPLANIDIINSIIEPDTNISVAAQTMMEKGADFFRSFASNSGDTDLPTGFIFYNFAVAESQTFAVLDVADGADIDSSIGGILHINSPLVFGIFRSLFVL